MRPLPIIDMEDASVQTLDSRCPVSDVGVQTAGGRTSLEALRERLRTETSLLQHAADRMRFYKSEAVVSRARADELQSMLNARGSEASSTESVRIDEGVGTWRVGTQTEVGESGMEERFAGMLERAIFAMRAEVHMQQESSCVPVRGCRRGGRQRSSRRRRARMQTMIAGILD